MAGAMYCPVRLVHLVIIKATYFTKNNLCNLCNLLTKKTSCCPCYLLFLNDCAAAEVEFRRERYAVHFLFGFVLECDFLFCYDSAG